MFFNPKRGLTNTLSLIRDYVCLFYVYKLAKAEQIRVHIDYTEEHHGRVSCSIFYQVVCQSIF